MAENIWRVPKLYPPRKEVYRRLPPKGDKLKEFAFVLEQIQHGHSQYENCPCCEDLASKLLPELRLIYNF